MATSEQQAPARATPAANVVGDAFVDQYYHMLHERPEHVHRFYQDISKLGRPERNGIMGITTTMHAINEKILSLGYGEFSAEIVSVDAQESFGGGVLVLVTGFMTGKDNLKQKFTQCFFLAPQDKGYYVLNDIFRFVDENGIEVPVDVEAVVTSDQDPSALEIHVTEKITAAAGVVDREEVHNPENGLNSSEDEDEEEEEAPVAEVVDEIPDDSNVVSDSPSIIEDVPKKSYASIVKVMKEGAVAPSTVTATVRSAPMIQDQQGTATQPPQKVPETTDSSANAQENGVNQEAEADGYSIYLKGLPSNATHALLENEFQRFGPIKSGGIQVRNQRGFSFGFVEFEVASAVQKAIEASPIVINGRNVVVEEKKSTNRGNSRGRFSSGRGAAAGYRNEGLRGRGNYGNGRGYDRADFNSRGDYGYRSGNRGGFPNRGSNGNQRNDQTGSNGGRTSRTAGLAVYAAARAVAARVSATA